MRDDSTPHPATALGVLVGFIVGVPWLNLATGGSPARLFEMDLGLIERPDRMWETARWAFLDGSAWPWLTHVSLWAIWLLGLWWIAAEIVSQRGDNAVPGRSRVLPRRWVAGLVAAVVATAPAAAVADSPGAVTMVEPEVPQTDRIRPPVDGQHDSLWAMSERVYGDGTLWPVIFEANHGHLQPNGMPFTNPDLVFVGEEMQTPHRPPPPPPPTLPPPVEQPTETVSPPPAVSDDAQPQQPTTTTLPSGAVVGTGLVLLVAATAATAGLRRRRVYVPGSGQRRDLTTAPIVRALRVANQELAEASRPPVGPEAGLRELLELARPTGLRLAGPGAGATARAVVTHVIAAGGEVLIAEPEFARLLDNGAVLGDLPSGLHVIDSEDAALARAEAEVLREPRAGAPFLLVTGRAHPRSTVHHLQERGVTILFTGPHDRGDAITLHADGTVAAGEPTLVGTRLPTIAAGDALALLLAFREPDPAEPPAPASSRAAHFTLNVLESVRLVGDAGNLTARLTRKQKELLTCLALHPNGLHRDALTEEIWHAGSASRPGNNLHNALSLMRRALTEAGVINAGELVLRDNGRYRLNHEIVDVDLWRFRRHAEASRRGQGAERLESLKRAVDEYTGDLAANLDAEWLDEPREVVRREVLDALAALVRGEPDLPAKLAFLERARLLDPYNESVYRDIMRVQARSGHPEIVPRTLSLLVANLSKIGESPQRSTIALAEELQNHCS